MTFQDIFKSDFLENISSISLLDMALAMVLGRGVYGLAMTAILGLTGGAYTWAAFVSGALLEAIPGIVLQLALIPLCILALKRARLMA